MFETFELSAIYLDELISNVSDEEIRKNEQEYSARLLNITRTLPQLRDLWVIDADGYPVVSGTVYPDAAHRPVRSRIFPRPQEQRGAQACISAKCWRRAPPT